MMAESTHDTPRMNPSQEFAQLRQQVLFKPVTAVASGALPDDKDEQDNEDGLGSSTGPGNDPVRKALLEMTHGLAKVAQALGGNPIVGSSHLAHGDPKFEDWDGSPNTLSSWIYKACALKKIRGTSDVVAIQYARLKLNRWVESTYPETNPPATWDEFIALLKNRFYPRIGKSKYG